MAAVNGYDLVAVAAEAVLHGASKLCSRLA